MCAYTLPELASDDAITPARQVGSGSFTVIAMTGYLAGMVARALADEVTGLAAAAFGAPPWNERPAHARQLTSRMLADAGHPVFTLAFAFSGRGPALAGFGYGVPRWPWLDAAAAGLARGDAEPFEFCELAVLPSARGRGAGRALHDAVIDASGPRQRWLVTHPAARPAVSLYRAGGWHATHQFAGRADGTARLLMTRGH